jgi:hypothetical protein
MWQAAISATSVSRTRPCSAASRATATKAEGSAWERDASAASRANCPSCVLAAAASGCDGQLATGVAVSGVEELATGWARVCAGAVTYGKGCVRTSSVGRIQPR